MTVDTRSATAAQASMDQAVKDSNHGINLIGGSDLTRDAISQKVMGPRLVTP